MTKLEFCSALRVLHSVDRAEIEGGGYRMAESEWERFRTDPSRMMMSAHPRLADAIFAAVEARMVCWWMERATAR